MGEEGSESAGIKFRGPDGLSERAHELPFDSVLPITSDGKPDFDYYMKEQPIYSSYAEVQLTYLTNYLTTGNFQSHQLFTAYSPMLNGPAHAHLTILAKILAKPETPEIQEKAVEAIAKFICGYLIKDSITESLEVFVDADFITSEKKIAVLEKMLERRELPGGFITLVDGYLKNQRARSELTADKRATVIALQNGIPKTKGSANQSAIRM